MASNVLQSLFSRFETSLEEGSFNIVFEPISIGLINDTWIVTCVDDDEQIKRQFVMQRINHDVFRNPVAIDGNNRLMLRHISQYHQHEVFPRLFPLKDSPDQSTLLHDHDSGNFYRLYEYVSQSYSLQALTAVDQAYEAAKAFGKFCRIFSTPLDVSEDLLSNLQDTIPDFHNLSLRYCQYKNALEKGIPERLEIAMNDINILSQMNDIIDVYSVIVGSNISNNNIMLTKRVTHHDCKISNMLFDQTTKKSICVVDLDTTMPGYFISDLGDMFRTFLPACSEEEEDLTKVDVRIEYFQAIVQGYLSEMMNILSSMELQYIVYAGEFIIYMQTLRFLADYLLGDIYYKVSHPKHNLYRARNQLKLLQSYRGKKNEMKDIVEKACLLLNKSD